MMVKMHSDERSTHLPPVFVPSLCPDIYTRLDAKIAERTRISNAGLYEQMLSQERRLDNHKAYTMKRYAEEMERVRQDLERICKCLPGLETHTHQSLIHDRLAANNKEIVDSLRKVRLCKRCYIHHTPYKDIYYTNWWLKNLANQREIFKLRF